MLTVKQAAAMLSATEAMILGWIKSGALDAVRDGRYITGRRRYLVPLRAAERFAYIEDGFDAFMDALRRDEYLERGGIAPPYVAVPDREYWPEVRIKKSGKSYL
jgi:excisionase family DNA binding protein